MFPSVPNWLISQCSKLLLWLSLEKCTNIMIMMFLVTVTVLSDPSQSDILLGLCGWCENAIHLIWLAIVKFITVHENDNWEISY